MLLFATEQQHVHWSTAAGRVLPMLAMLNGITHAVYWTLSRGRTTAQNNRLEASNA